MPYCLYLRKSRADLEAEAHGEGETLARHEAALMSLAARQNTPIKTVYREIVSGETISARPVMQRLLSEVGSGAWEGVLVAEIERLARGDTVDQGLVAQAFQTSGTKIITPTKMYDPRNEFDEEYFEFSLFMSRREYKTINRRIQAGRLASVREGKYIAAEAPYGYRKEKLVNQKGFVLAVHEEEAKFVQMIFQMYISGAGIAAIIRRMEELGAPPRKSARWAMTTIRRIISSPVYIGYMPWGVTKGVKDFNDGMKKKRVKAEGEHLYKGLHTPLVDEAVWYKAQAIREQKILPHIAQSAVLKNPLSGLVYCADCGYAMQRHTPKMSQPERDVLTCDTRGCLMMSHRIDLVELGVLDSLRQWVAETEFIYAKADANKPNVDFEKNALQKIRKELANAKKQKERLYTLLEQGTYTAEIFTERSEALKKKIDSAKAEQACLEIKIDTAANACKRNYTALPRVKRVIELYGEMSNAERRNALLKEVVERVTYRKAKDDRCLMLMLIIKVV